MKKILFFTTLNSLFIFYSLSSQTNEELYSRGIKYRSEFNTKEAFPIFQKLLKSDSNNLNYLSNTSYFYSKVGYNQPTESEKFKYYKIAEYLALKAIKLDEKNADGHYVYAMVLGRLNENASSKEKIANSKLIKTEAERSIELNPNFFGPYHILGRWHRTIAGFNFMEKAMVDVFYGGVPTGASYEKSVEYFQKAIMYEPKYLLNMYELAVTYHEMGKDVEAKLWLKKVLLVKPAVGDENKSAQTKSAELLEKIE